MDFLEDQDTTAQQGSKFRANATTTKTPDVFEAFEHVEAATAVDCTAVTNLTQSNQALSEEFQTRNNKLQASQVANATLQQKMLKIEQDFAMLKASV